MLTLTDFWGFAYLSLAARIVISLLLLVSGIGKLMNFREFSEAVAAYRILPFGAISPFAYAVPTAEVLAGLSLLFHLWSPIPEGAAATLFLLFGMAIGINLIRGRTKISCGCFAGGSQRISLSLVTRNLMLAAVAILGTGSFRLPSVLLIGICGLMTVILSAVGSRLVGKDPHQVGSTYEGT